LGFDGPTCDHNIDDCDPNPCQNGGTCYDEINCSFSLFSFLFRTEKQPKKKKQKKKTAFSCECPEENTGLLCDNNSDYCSPNPCQHDGTCSSEDDAFSCDCTGTGFEGTKCQTNINDCSPNPCQNNGTCTDGINCNFFFFLSYFFLFENKIN